MNRKGMTNAEATTLCASIEKAWNTRDPSAFIRLLTSDAVWRDNDRVHVGRDEIWTVLERRWQRALHYRMRQCLSSHGVDRIRVDFESEWQDALHGDWHRAGGQCEFHVDSARRITTLESTDVHTRITTTDRRLKIGPVESTRD